MSSWVIGSAADCDVVVDRKTVSGHHCRLTKRPDGFYLEDLGSANGTYVGGKRLSTAVRVSQTDAITLGKDVALPWPKVVFTVGSKIVSIGQSENNDIVLNKPMVSGHHARILMHGSEMVLEDLGSTNGTFLESPSNRIKSARVRPDDKVFFGSHSVQVRQLLDGINLGDAVTSPPATGNVATKVPTVSSAASKSRSPGNSWLDFATKNKLLLSLAGGAALLICVVVVALANRSTNQEPPSPPQADNENTNTTKKVLPANSTKRKAGILVGRRLEPTHSIERIKVTIWIDAKQQDLKEPVDLDLGAGFYLRLPVGSGEVPIEMPIAFPQKSSLDPTAKTVAAGSSASFEFSAEDGGSGASQATPQILAGASSVSTIRSIQFGATGKTDWVLEGYKIEINGELLVSNDSFNWRVRSQLATEQHQLDSLSDQRRTLEEEIIPELQAKIDAGIANDADQKDLEAKRQDLLELEKEINARRARKGSWHKEARWPTAK